MKKLGLTLVMAMMVMMFVVGEAWALLYTPSLDDIVAWDLVYATNNSGVSGGSPTVLTSSGSDVKIWSKEDGRPCADFVNFVVIFEKKKVSPYTYTGYAAFGSTTAQDLSGFDSYSLSIYNSNENPWMYALWVGNYDNSTYSVYHTAPVSLANGRGQQFTLDLGAVPSTIDLTNAYIGFAVGSDSLPLSGDDFTSETRVAPVPEPGTMALLGVGLLGLAFFGRKKLKIEE